jgi:hypothetical protein
VKSLRLSFIIPALIVLLPGLLSAQTKRNTREYRTNHKQVAVDKHQVVRDTRELDEFQRLLGEIDALRETNATDSFQRVNIRIRTAMNRELEQAHSKAGQASREVNQSQREKRGERQEADLSGFAGDYGQLFDDRGDLRDDRRDLQGAALRALRMDSILSRSDKLQPGVRNGNVDAIIENRRLMGEFLEVMRADLASTKGELVEDRQEKREDRRERRSDRSK